MRDQLDLPRLNALTKRWKTIPPPALQLARIASFLGLKAEPDAPAGASNDDMTDFGPVATAPRPKILTPEQFKAGAHG